MSHRNHHAQRGGNRIEPIFHENLGEKNTMNNSTIFFKILIIFHAIKKQKRRGGKEGRGGDVYHYPRTILHSFLFVIFFFMQKSCGQFVDVSDLNLVVCYLI